MTQEIPSDGDLDPPKMGAIPRRRDSPGRDRPEGPEGGTAGRSDRRAPRSTGRLLGHRGHGDMVEVRAGVQGRVAAHVGRMTRALFRRIPKILSFDSDFDGVIGFARVS